MQPINGLSDTLTSVPKSIRALAMMLALSAGGTLGVSAALADDDKKDAPKVDRIEGDFDQHIEQKQPARGRPGGSTFSITNSWTQNGKSYSVSNRNGDISVKVDGKTLPADRWREADGKLEILNEDGDVEATTDMPSMNNGGVNLRWGGQGDGRNAENMDQLRRLRDDLMVPQAPAAPRPPVMLGINMSVVEDGVLVDRVIEDLPADKAGLREGDVITKVGDRVVEDTTDVVQALRDRKPGDRLDIIVMRDGRERTLTADLVAYDMDAIEVPGMPMFPVVPGVPEVPGLAEMPMLEDLPLFGRNFTREQTQLREQLEKLTQNLRDEAERLEKDHGDAAKALEEAKKALQSAADELAKASEQLAERRARANVWVAPGGQGNGQMFVLPENGNRVRVERERDRPRGTTQPRESSDDMKELRDELRQLREEMKELREKNEQQNKDKP